jgi:gas vesicle protein
MAAEEGSGGGFVTGLLLGLLAGATLAMVASPRSGEETRDAWRAKARDAADRARDAAGGFGESANELLERGRAVVDEARARVDEAVAEGRDAAEQQRNELQSRT